MSSVSLGRHFSNSVITKFRSGLIKIDIIEVCSHSSLSHLPVGVEMYVYYGKLDSSGNRVENGLVYSRYFNGEQLGEALEEVLGNYIPASRDVNT